jgi:hypothetical protein
VTKQPPDWLELTGRWEGDFGDGTVPAYSALPRELDNHTKISHWRANVVLPWAGPVMESRLTLLRVALSERKTGYA